METIEVQAKPIETEIAALSEAEKWLASTAESVTDECAKYIVPKTIASEDIYQSTKKSRVDCRKAYDKYDAERKALLENIESKLAEFKSSVKDVLSPLSDLDVQYTELISAYEKQWREQRISELANVYATEAPDLVEHVDEETGEIEDAIVPFERVLKHYGYVTGRKWLGRSTKYVLILEDIKNAVHDIRENEKALDSTVDDPDILRVVKSLYFETLDYDRAKREANRLKAQQERVRALEFERKQRELEEQAKAQPKVEPKPQPTVEPSPAYNDVPHAWVMVIGSATKAQVLMVRDFLRSQGIEGGTIYSGTIDDAFRKEHFGA